ncbi:MAG: hypothetical protein KDK66_03990, partial [Deltaproteobacteria bacterium]|nr:hypothetical protein [Deltaproteobacteria bacterium]
MSSTPSATDKPREIQIGQAPEEAGASISLDSDNAEASLNNLWRGPNFVTDAMGALDAYNTSSVADAYSGVRAYQVLNLRSFIGFDSGLPADLPKYWNFTHPVFEDFGTVDLMAHWNGETGAQILIRPYPQGHQGTNWQDVYAPLHRWSFRPKSGIMLNEWMLDYGYYNFIDGPNPREVLATARPSIKYDRVMIDVFADLVGELSAHRYPEIYQDFDWMSLSKVFSDDAELVREGRLELERLRGTLQGYLEVSETMPPVKDPKGSLGIGDIFEVASRTNATRVGTAEEVNLGTMPKGPVKEFSIRIRGGRQSPEDLRRAILFLDRLLQEPDATFSALVTRASLRAGPISGTTNRHSEVKAVFLFTNLGLEPEAALAFTDQLTDVIFERFARFLAAQDNHEGMLYFVEVTQHFGILKYPEIWRDFDLAHLGRILRGQGDQVDFDALRAVQREITIKLGTAQNVGEAVDPHLHYIDSLIN